MSWTKGQSRRENESPYIHQDTPGENNTSPATNNYFKANGRRSDYNHRQPQHNAQKDVAATFTQEGLQAFAQIFSTSVEAAIAKALPEKLDEAIAKQLKTMKNELVEALRATLIEQVAHAIDERVSSLLQEHLASDKTVVQTTTEVEQSGTDLVTPDSRASISREVEAVIQQLKDIGRPVQANELQSLLTGIRWSGNVSAKMTKLINRSNGQILRKGRGLYQYCSIDS